MKRPTAITLDAAQTSSMPLRSPRAFSPSEASATSAQVDSLSNAPVADLPLPARRTHWPTRLLWGTAGLLLSLAVGLGVNALIAGLFAANPWLGWVGLGIAALFALALVALLFKEIGSLRRLRTLDRLKARAASAFELNAIKRAQPIVEELTSI